LIESAVPAVQRALMDPGIIFQRTPKGERETSLRSLPHEPWLTLVMVDGKSSVGDLAALKPALPDVAPSIERLLHEGYIETVSSPDAPMLATRASERGKHTPMAHEEAAAGLDFSGIAARWGRRGLVLLPFLVVAAALLLAHQSLELFSARLEEALAKQGQSVSIGSSSFIFTPRPALRLTDISVGKALKVREVIAQPGWSLLMGRSGPITLLEIREGTLKAAELLALLQGGGALSASEFRLERVMLSATKIDLDGIMVAPIAGDLRYGRKGQLEHATLLLDDGRARLTVTPEEGRSAVEFSARNWSTPTAPAVGFERLDASGSLESNRLVLDRVEGLLSDGLVKGNLTLDWSVGLVAEGRFSATNLELQNLIGGFTRDFSVGGRLDAEGTFNARADTAAALIENVSVVADFRVKRGVLYNADIAATAAGDVRGGTTRFEELTGHIQTAGRGFSLRGIQMGSGLLTAKGILDVTPSRQIMGRFTVRLKSQGDSSSTISVSGTLKEPRLQFGG
jgi:hypothetical protein